MSVIIVVVETEQPVDAGELKTAETIVRVVMGDTFGGLKWSSAMFCDEERSAALREELGPRGRATVGGGQ